MKQLFILAVLFFLHTSAFCQQTEPIHTSARAPEDAAAYLYQMKDYFSLQELIHHAGKKIPVSLIDYYTAILDNRFCRFAPSIAKINQLLNRKCCYSQQDRVELYYTQADNYLKTYQYNKAYLQEKALLSEYGSILSAEQKEDINNYLSIYQSLCHTAPQQMIYKKTVIPFTKNNIGSRMVPVTLGGQTIDFIFDSGAGISTITESLARKNGFTIFAAPIKVGTITSAVVEARMAVAKSFKLGDVELRNAVFLVMPDSALYISPLKLQIEGIVGYPVISALGQIVISYNDNTLSIDKKPVDHDDLVNFCMDELAPIIALGKEEDILPFSLDTGANTSTLYVPYFLRYRASVEGQAKEGQCEINGGGGKESFPCYTLEQCHLRAGHADVTLKNIDLLTRKSTSNSDHFYGNIGQDFISQFSEVIFNFNKMVIAFKK